MMNVIKEICNVISYLLLTECLTSSLPTFFLQQGTFIQSPDSFHLYFSSSRDLFLLSFSDLTQKLIPV